MDFSLANDNAVLQIKLTDTVWRARKVFAAKSASRACV